jgi:hypothetical protein
VLDFIFLKNIYSLFLNLPITASTQHINNNNNNVFMDVDEFGTEHVVLYSIYNSYLIIIGARGNVVVKALCYKPESRRFGTR